MVNMKTLNASFIYPVEFANMASESSVVNF